MMTSYQITYMEQEAVMEIAAKKPRARKVKIVDYVWKEKD